jgi:hypothetical protein
MNLPVLACVLVSRFKLALHPASDDLEETELHAKGRLNLRWGDCAAEYWLHPRLIYSCRSGALRPLHAFLRLVV